MEQRRHQRFPLHLPIAYSKAFTGDPPTQEGETLNLSVGGCLVGKSTPPPLGTFLYLRTYLEKKQAWIKIEVAAVRWVQEDSFGVEFIQFQPDQEDQLQNYLKSVTATQAN